MSDKPQQPQQPHQLRPHRCNDRLEDAIHVRHCLALPWLLCALPPDPCERVLFRLHAGVV